MTRPVPAQGWHPAEGGELEDIKIKALEVDPQTAKKIESEFYIDIYNDSRLYSNVQDCLLENMGE